MTVPFPPDFRSTLDADVEIRGSSREQLIGGLVNLRRTEYTQDIELADLINTRRGESIEEGAEIELTRTACLRRCALKEETRWWCETISRISSALFRFSWMDQ